MVDFLIIGPQSGCWYNEIFPMIRDKKVYLGYIKFLGNRSMKFQDLEGNIYKATAIWFQNILFHKVKELVMTKKFEDGYEYFDDYPALSVKSYKEIPMDYYGLMGMPVMGFLTRWDMRQFDLVETTSPRLNGKVLFENIIIKRRRDG